MHKYIELKEQLKRHKKKWLITGVAGFIGSNILETLLSLDQSVTGLDNFSGGFKQNLQEVRSIVGEKKWNNFNFIEGDIRNYACCEKVLGTGIDVVLHQAAIGSVPRSIERPIETNASNVDGFLNMLVASQKYGVEKFVYAASSSTYGDSKVLPKREESIGNPMSPYAVSKYVNELYADVFQKIYGINCIGLRYFNVFGPRQNTQGGYAAVIPKWVDSMMRSERITIYGDGNHISRDFCYVENVVQANIISGVNAGYPNNIFNIAVGKSTNLMELFCLIKQCLNENNIPYGHDPIVGPSRIGDVSQSLADISRAKKELLYVPEFEITEGMRQTVKYYLKKC